MIAGLMAMLLAAADTTPHVAPLALDAGAVAAVVAGLPVVSPAALEPDRVAGPPPGAALAAFEPRLRWPVTADTVVRKKRTLVEYSEWYGRRVTIHKTLSWAMLPLFGISYYTGTRLANDGRAGSPGWVRGLHPFVAGADVAVFGINTLTGAWNLWDARHDPEGRTRRIIHSVLFMAANAGFAWAGATGEDAGEELEGRNRHRNIALASMSVSTVSWLIMLIGK
ncbi:MAG: hypothetical protein IT355_21040 [Gemmatimonadaceae bacterium]|nr:hypothetical protein [Gemmatimonadaceae bacterium]